MVPLAALGAMKGGGGGMPGFADSSTSSASSSVNFAGMTVGGPRAPSTDLPDFVRAKMGGATAAPSMAMPSGQTVMLLGAALLLGAVLWKMR